MTMVDAQDSRPRLTAHLEEPLQKVLDDEKLLQDLIQGFGSPLNLVLPKALLDNAAKCRAVLDSHDLTSRVFVAHKPNRSGAFIRAAAVMNGLNLDVASEGELRSGLVNGFTGSRIEATGPKNDAFLRLALQHDVLINVDNVTELERIATIRRLLDQVAPARVVIRLNSLTQVRAGSDTKFGVSPAEVDRALNLLTEHRGQIEFLGFAFHLTFSTARERAAATEVLIDQHIRALQVGLSPSVINIGGGFKVNFLRDSSEWNAYVNALKAGLLGTGPNLSWNGDSFGMSVADNRITGAANLASFSRTDTASVEIDAFLRTPLRRHGGRSVAAFLVENSIELHIEPGRAIFDQAGVTLARVNFVKSSALGETLVGLDMNRSNLDSSDREFFVDPILICDDLTREGAAVSVYFTGNLCLPGDMITRHKTSLPTIPKPGDIVAFPNTAGYFMDFIESETLLQRTAPKVALALVGGRLRWYRDEDFNPLVLGSAA